MTLDTLWRHDFLLSGINAMRQRWNDGDTYTFRRSARGEHGLMYFLSCSAVYETRDGGTVTAQPGELFYVAKSSNYVVRFFNSQPQPCSCLLVNFQLHDESGADFAPGVEVMRLSGIGGDEAERAMSRLINLYYAAAYAPAEMKGVLYQLLVQISRRLYGAQAPTRPRQIEPALRWLDQHYHEEIGVAELAAMCCLSESGFRRRFTEYAGLSPTQYRLNRRIDQAMRLLRADSASIGEIAASVGFDDLNYFSRLFHKKTGMTPSEYIKQSDLC